MEFFVENWLWFLVAAIIILMTLIGYIAEKTDFGRKDIPKREKIKKEKPKKEKQQPKAEELADALEEPMPEVQMSLATDSIFEEPEQALEESEDMNAESEIMESFNTPFEDTNGEESATEQELGENLNNSFDDFTYSESIANVEEPIETLESAEGPTNFNENVETLDDFTIPFGDADYTMPTDEVEEVVENEPVEELNLEDVNTPNIELPDLDSIVTEEDDTDDVWRF